jgi:uncharacterized protein (TIGR02231 family)
MLTVRREGVGPKLPLSYSPTVTVQPKSPCHTVSNPPVSATRALVDKTLSVVTKASWTPLYDLRARLSATKKDESAVTVHYRASIKQLTGEDWNDVALTLSTASPLMGTTIPTLAPYKIGTMRTMRQLAGLRRSLSATASAMASSMASPMGAGLVGARFSVPDEEAEEELSVRMAVVNDEGAGSATFSIPGFSSIPTGTVQENQTHKVTITEVELEAELEWVVVPKASKNAFLSVC